MNKRLLLTVLTLMLILCGCSGTDVRDDISDALCIDVSSAEIVTKEDDHGGFHGDGMAFMILDCSGTDISDQIGRSKSWSQFPLDDTVSVLVYGMGDETSMTGPYLTDEDGDSLIPEIEEGYYLLIDRQEEEGNMAGEDILHRASFNFTLGIYDSNTDILYYCELDT